MPRFAHRILNLAAFALTLMTGQAAAQDNFDANKTPAQLFANDCSGCHKSPAGLIKSSGLFGVESFLREHYTASRQAAAAIAGYLRAVDAEQSAAPAKRGKSEPRRKADKPVKKDDGKSVDSKAEKEKKTESKAEKKGEPKPEAKSEPKQDTKSETKPAEPKAQTKTEAQPEAKPAENKPAETPKAEPAKPEEKKSE